METLCCAIRSALDWWGRGEIVKHLFDLGILKFFDNAAAGFILLAIGFLWLGLQPRLRKAEIRLLDTKGSPIERSRYAPLQLALAGLIGGIVLSIGVGFCAYFHLRAVIGDDHAGSSHPAQPSTPVPFIGPPPPQSSKRTARKRVQSEAPRGQWGREPILECPNGMPRFYSTGATISDNKGCAIQAKGPVCVMVGNQTFIQRNSGGGVCIDASQSATPPTSDKNSAASPPCVQSTLQNVRIVGMYQGISESGNNCVNFDDSTIKNTVGPAAVTVTDKAPEKPQEARPPQ
jgi:hypothetical protein